MKTFLLKKGDRHPGPESTESSKQAETKEAYTKTHWIKMAKVNHKETVLKEAEENNELHTKETP